MTVRSKLNFETQSANASGCTPASDARHARCQLQPRRAAEQEPLERRLRPLALLVGLAALAARLAALANTELSRQYPPPPL